MNVIGFPPWALNGVALLGIYMLAVSAATFLVYAADKSAAERGRWRVRERTLHLWSLLGGWPGAFLAQRALRHKTRKEEFLSAFWRTVAANCGFIGLATVVFALSVGGSGGETWRVDAFAGEAVVGNSSVDWREAAVGALAGAVSMFVLRIPLMGYICLALPTVTAVVVLTTVGIDGMAMLSDRIFAFAENHPAGLLAAVFGQATAALLGTGVRK